MVVSPRHGTFVFFPLAELRHASHDKKALTKHGLVPNLQGDSVLLSRWDLSDWWDSTMLSNPFYFHSGRVRKINSCSRHLRWCLVSSSWTFLVPSLSLRGCSLVTCRGWTHWWLLIWSRRLKLSLTVWTATSHQHCASLSLSILLCWSVHRRNTWFRFFYLVLSYWRIIFLLLRVSVRHSSIMNWSTLWLPTLCKCRHLRILYALFKNYIRHRIS